MEDIIEMSNGQAWPGATQVQTSRSVMCAQANMPHMLIMPG